MGGFSISVRERGSTKQKGKGKEKEKVKAARGAGGVLLQTTKNNFMRWCFFFDIYTLALSFSFLSFPLTMTLFCVRDTVPNDWVRRREGDSPMLFHDLFIYFICCYGHFVIVILNSHSHTIDFLERLTGWALGRCHGNLERGIQNSLDERDILLTAIPVLVA